MKAGGMQRRVLKVVYYDSIRTKGLDVFGCGGGECQEGDPPPSPVAFCRMRVDVFPVLMESRIYILNARRIRSATELLNIVRPSVDGNA
jgi:hypothetical protein